MGLTIREGRKIARTEATIDRVYRGRAARGGGGANGTGLLIFGPMTRHKYMPIIAATLGNLRDLLMVASYIAGAIGNKKGRAMADPAWNLLKLVNS